MRVLGIDPGLTRCGLGVIDGRPGRASMVAVGVVRTPASADPGQRLERVFADVNVASVMTTAHATAVALLTAAKRGLPVHFHTPTEVKAAVTGSGRADKNQVTLMVTRILSLDAPPKPADAADALALAICHAWRGVATNRLAALAGTQ